MKSPERLVSTAIAQLPAPALASVPETVTLSPRHAPLAATSPRIGAEASGATTTSLKEANPASTGVPPVKPAPVPRFWKTVPETESYSATVPLDSHGRRFIAMRCPKYALKA